MAYPPDYRYFSTSDKHYVKNYGLTCIGILIMVMIFFVIISLPATIFWISYAPLEGALLSIFLFQVAPLSALLIVFIWFYKHRDEETGQDDLIPVERP